MFGSVAAKLPWAVILCRFKGSPADFSLEGPIEKFYRGAFAPGPGSLIEYGGTYRWVRLTLAAPVSLHTGVEL